MQAYVEVRTWKEVDVNREEFITQREAANLVGVSINSISSALAAGTLPIILMGKTRGTTKAAVKAWIENKGRWNKKNE